MTFSGIDPKSEFIITGFRFLVYETDLCRIDDIYGYFRCISILYRMESGEEKRNEIKR